GSAPAILWSIALLCSAPAILRSAAAILWSATSLLRLRLGQPNHSVILALLTGVGRSPALVGCRLSVATYGPCLRGQNPDVARSIRATRGVRDSVRTRMRPVRYAIRSLCGLHPESLRDRGELVADLLNAGGELPRATQIHDLAGLRQPACNRRIGLNHGADVGGNAFAQRHRHSARPANQAVSSEIGVPCSADGWSVGSDSAPLAAGHRQAPNPPRLNQRMQGRVG